MNQPNTPTYPASDLNLFSTLVRGTLDPPFDPTKRPKNWLDSGALATVGDPTQFVQYTVFHKSPIDGSYIITKIYMPASEAAVTNFPDQMPAAPPKLPAWESPVRDLLPNEQLLPTPFALLIQRTDLTETPVNFSQSDRDAIIAIKNKVGA